jgi:hypothetical protein
MRIRRVIGTITTGTLLTALGFTLVPIPARAQTQITRTCSAAMGVPWTWINFNVAVTVSDGSVIIAAADGDAYLTGLFTGAVTHTHPAQITHGAHWVHFSGHAVVASGIPNTPLSVSQEFGCEAFWTI